MTELDQTLKTAVTRLLQLQQQRQDIDAEETHLKAVVRTHLNVGDKGCVDGQPVITVTPNRRFNAALAADLPEPLLKLCLVEKVDGPTAKKNLPPTVYEQCMTEVGEPVVRLL